ncbi:MAG TPA: tRNA (adenosine(37)-N6)-dimethylallyltransferase MiaA [Coriobacteriia bacterium]|nr:tRNA (adenosine(37)-N6)-dimethylallyltransferase MiaA [Coriobacteriia bacterium]
MSSPSEPNISQDHGSHHRSVRVVAVVGPTAVGKSALAEHIAVRLGGEIVSADSMQVYRGMDIGTAKTPSAERRVPYHCIDLAEPGDAYSAALYQRAGRAAIADIASRGKLPVVVGGTGMYVRALLDPWEFPAGEQVDNPVRERLEQLADELGADGLHLYLRDKDPRSAELIHPNNVRRVVRALEMLEQGVSYADQHAGFASRESLYDVSVIGLTMEREALYQRINARVDEMLAAGLLDEVRCLLEAGLRAGITAQYAIGYKELVPVLEGARELSDAVDEIKQSTRRYAKRQLTWLRSDERVRWIDVTDLTFEQAAEAALAAIECGHDKRCFAEDAG